MGLCAGVAGAYGPMVAPGIVVLAQDLGVPVTVASQDISWMILTIGLSLFVINPLGKVYGKRPIYVFAITMLFISSIIGGLATSQKVFLASRIVGAFGQAPFEILVQCTIGDMYFIHQRGTRIAFWNLCLIAGVSLGSLIAGYIIQNLGWNWCFWICGILNGVLLICVLLFVPETSYVRTDNLVIRPTIETQESSNGVWKEKVVMHIEREHHQTPGHHHTPDSHAPHNPTSIEKPDVEREVSRSSAGPIPPKMSYWRSLRLYSGRYSEASMLKIFTRPFILVGYPAVFAVFAIYGVMITWVVVFTIVTGTLFVAPPYNFTVGQNGLTNLSPFVLNLIGEVLAGPLNDAICVFLTRKNNGIYEPEFRLVMMILVVILGATGYYGFGATVHYETHWSGPVLTLGISNMALAFASTSLFGYVIDSYPNLNEEAFVAVNARNILAFGLAYVIEDWLIKDGTLNVFIVLGSIFLAVSLFTVPLWIFGKRWRSSIARNKFLTEFMKDYD